MNDLQRILERISQIREDLEKNPERIAEIERSAEQEHQFLADAEARMKEPRKGKAAHKTITTQDDDL